MRFPRRPLLVFALLTAGLAAAPASQAALIVGGNYGGANLNLNNGDILSGTFTNIGTLSIGAGVTVFVDSGAILSVSAGSINIAGTLNGTGAGFAGGAAVANLGVDCLVGQNGNVGGGPGGGGGGHFGPCVHGSGGGGGGYGGAGGRSSSAFGLPAVAGGAAYGDASSATVAMGSGGGSGAPYNLSSGSSGQGGSGGGAISLAAAVIQLTGAILVDGVDGGNGVAAGTSTAAGGGGSGGSILLNGQLDLNGLLSAAGGDGGDGGTTGLASGGGGGSGGRIKLFGPASFGANFAYDVTGGSGGSYFTSAFFTVDAPSAAGAAGTYNYDTARVPEPEPVPALAVPEPGGLALFGLGMAVLGAVRRRARDGLETV